MPSCVTRPSLVDPEHDGEAGETSYDVSLCATVVRQLLHMLLFASPTSQSTAPDLYERLRDVTLPRLVAFANDSHPFRQIPIRSAHCCLCPPNETKAASSSDMNTTSLFQALNTFIAHHTLDKFVLFVAPSETQRNDDKNAKAERYAVMKHGSEKKAMEVTRMRDFLLQFLKQNASDGTENHGEGMPEWSCAGGPTVIDVGAGQGDLCGVLSLAGIPSVALERDTTQFTAIMNRIASRIAAERKRRKHLQMRQTKQQQQSKNGAGHMGKHDDDDDDVGELNPAEVCLCKVDVRRNTTGLDVYQHIRDGVLGESAENSAEDGSQAHMRSDGGTSSMSTLSDANDGAAYSVVYDAWGRPMTAPSSRPATARAVSNAVMLGRTTGYAMCSLHSCGSLSDHIIQLWANWCNSNKVVSREPNSTLTLNSEHGPSADAMPSVRLLPACNYMVCLGCCYGLMANPDVRLTYLGEGAKNIDGTTSIVEGLQRQQQQQQPSTDVNAAENGFPPPFFLTQNIAAQTLHFPGFTFSDDKQPVFSVNGNTDRLPLGHKLPPMEREPSSRSSIVCVGMETTGQEDDTGKETGSARSGFFMNRNALMTATQAPLRWRIVNDDSNQKTTKKPSHDKSKRQQKKHVNQKRPRDGVDETDAVLRDERTKETEPASSSTQPKPTQQEYSADILGALKSIDRMAVQYFLFRIGFVTQRESTLKLPTSHTPPETVVIPPSVKEEVLGKCADQSFSAEEELFIKKCIHTWDYLKASTHMSDSTADKPEDVKGHTAKLDHSPHMIAKTASDVFRYFYTEACELLSSSPSSTHTVSRAEVAGAVWVMRALLGQIVEALILVSRCYVLHDLVASDDEGKKLQIALHAIFPHMESPRNVAVVAKRC